MGRVTKEMKAGIHGKRGFLRRVRRKTSLGKLQRAAPSESTRGMSNNGERKKAESTVNNTISQAIRGGGEKVLRY